MFLKLATAPTIVSTLDGYLTTRYSVVFCSVLLALSTLAGRKRVHLRVCGHWSLFTVCDGRLVLTSLGYTYCRPKFKIDSDGRVVELTSTSDKRKNILVRALSKSPPCVSSEHRVIGRTFKGELLKITECTRTNYYVPL